jgi:hypothetical protein
LMKFNNRLKKLKENLENTLGERESHLRFEDPEEKGSQIFKKLKGFSRENPKSSREPLAAARDGVEEKKMPRVLGGRLAPLYRLETRVLDMSEPRAGLV